MYEDNRSADREAIWGINSKDRRWFQLMTLLGGAGGSVTSVWLTLRYRADDTPDAVAFRILLAIGASFVAAGFVAWSLLQVKEIAMPIGDWIREANERRRRRLRDEGYRLGYQDAVQGKPPEVPLEQTDRTPPRESDESDANRDR